MLKITSWLQILKADIEYFQNSIDFYIIKQRDEPKKKKDVFNVFWWVKFHPDFIHRYCPFTDIVHYCVEQVITRA